MRILLDEHISPRRVGEPLRAAGHDVLAASAHPGLEAVADEPLLAFAAADGRVLVTRNVRYFHRILAEWGGSGRSHAGCVLVQGIDSSQHGALLRGLELLFEDHSDQEAWVDLSRWLTSSSPG